MDEDKQIAASEAIRQSSPKTIPLSPFQWEMFLRALEKSFGEDK